MRINEITEAVVDPESAKEHTTTALKGEVLKFIQTKCYDAFEGIHKSHFICKGMKRREEPFYFTDSSKILRTSQNTANFYTEFTSNYSELWQQLPPRNRSLICTSSASTAMGYSRSKPVYYVFPVNGTKIGICSEDDFWDSFFNYGKIESMGEFAEHMHDLQNGLNLNMADFLATIIPPNASTHNWYELFKYRGKTVYDALEDIMNPMKNGFTVLNTAQYYSNRIFNKEVWFSGPAALVRSDIINDL
jgi:hypothetical protein